MKRSSTSFLRKILHGLMTATGAVLLTLAFFLVLPLMQAISKPPAGDLELQSLDTAQLPPPPPPPPEPEPEQEPEQEEPPPELVEEAPPLDLTQLELALEPGFGEGLLAGDFALKLNTLIGGAQAQQDDFDLAVDQEPRPTYQASPVLDAKARKKTPGAVYLVFVVDERGRVQDPRVESSSDPVFERPALAAIKRWKFEPGKRNGKPVARRARIPFTFPAGS